MADLRAHIGDVARHLYGEPNKRLSSSNELRFGSNGSLAIDLKNGRWYDHEAECGGGVVDLIKRKGVQNGGVSDWLRDNLGLQDRAPEKQQERKEIEATFDYTDEHGALLFQAVRYRFVDAKGQVVVKDGKPKKTYSQRRPDGAGGWVWSLKGVRIVPYMLSDLLEALAEDRMVFIAEGERKVDTLREMGCPATCNPMGAGKWPSGFSEIFAGANIVILPDNDDAGVRHTDLVAFALSPNAASIRVLELPGLPPKGDIIEWQQAGGTPEQLYELAERAPLWGRYAAAIAPGWRVVR